MSYTSNTVLNAIDVALETERKVNRFYLDSIGKIKNLEQRNILSKLASFEEDHYQKLRSMKENLVNDTAYKINKNRETPISEEDKSKLIEIMNMAIESEERAFEAYSILSDTIDDPEWKKKFRELADEEQADRKMLADELYNISNRDGVWHWGD